MRAPGLPRTTATATATALAIGLAIGLGACVPSNVVAVRDRDVVTVLDSVEWRPATRRDVAGMFGSEQISGAIAAGLQKIYYLFEADGTFAAAALVADEGGREFRVLSGTWVLADESITLGEDGVPARIEAADDGLLRITGEDGVVVLRRDDPR